MSLALPSLTTTPAQPRRNWRAVQRELERAANPPRNILAWLLAKEPDFAPQVPTWLTVHRSLRAILAWNLVFTCFVAFAAYGWVHSPPGQRLRMWRPSMEARVVKPAKVQTVANIQFPIVYHGRKFRSFEDVWGLLRANSRLICVYGDELRHIGRPLQRTRIDWRAFNQARVETLIAINVDLQERVLRTLPRGDFSIRVMANALDNHRKRHRRQLDFLAAVTGPAAAGNQIATASHTRLFPASLGTRRLSPPAISQRSQPIGTKLSLTTSNLATPQPEVAARSGPVEISGKTEREG